MNAFFILYLKMNVKIQILERHFQLISFLHLTFSYNTIAVAICRNLKGRIYRNSYLTISH